MPTPLRNVRLSDDVWLPAMRIARERGENLSAVIREALVRYVRRNS